MKNHSIFDFDTGIKLHEILNFEKSDTIESLFLPYSDDRNFSVFLLSYKYIMSSPAIEINKINASIKRSFANPAISFVEIYGDKAFCMFEVGRFDVQHALDFPGRKWMVIFRNGFSTTFGDFIPVLSEINEGNDKGIVKEILKITSACGRFVFQNGGVLQIFKPVS